MLNLGRFQNSPFQHLNYRLPQRFHSEAWHLEAMIMVSLHLVLCENYTKFVLELLHDENYFFSRYLTLPLVVLLLLRQIVVLVLQ